MVADQAGNAISKMCANQAAKNDLVNRSDEPL